MASLKHRLALLESRQAPASAARLILIGTIGKPDAEIIGIAAGGPRLPCDVMRRDAESLDDLTDRAAAQVQLPGPLAVTLIYRGEHGRV